MVSNGIANRSGRYLIEITRLSAAEVRGQITWRVQYAQTTARQRKSPFGEQKRGGEGVSSGNEIPGRGV